MGGGGFEPPRITSYNVCYTKLLRVSVYGFTDVPFIEKGAEQCGIEEEPITLAVNTPKENILFAINAGSVAELNMGAVVEIEVSEKGTTIIRPSGGSGSGGGGHIQVLCINDCHYFPQGIYESYNYETITLLRITSYNVCYTKLLRHCFMKDRPQA